MKKQIDILINLNEIETKINNVKSALNNVPDRIDALDAKLKEFEQIIEHEGIILNELNKKYRAYEADAQINDSAVKKIEEKRISVKTNKEYHALIKEEEQLKAKKSQIEDEMILCLEHMDESKKALAAKKDEHCIVKDQTENEKDFIRNEAGRKNKELHQLDKEKSVVADKLDPELLKKYNAVKKRQADNVAMALVKNAVCLGCNMNIPPQMYNELQRLNSLIFCPFCYKILYWKHEETV